jgi:hypothetical protein
MLLAGRYLCLRLSASGSRVGSEQQSVALVILRVILPPVHLDVSGCPYGDESG